MGDVIFKDQNTAKQIPLSRCRENMPPHLNLKSTNKEESAYGNCTKWHEHDTLTTLKDSAILK